MNKAVNNIEKIDLYADTYTEAEKLATSCIFCALLTNQVAINVALENIKEFRKTPYYVKAIKNHLKAAESITKAYINRVGFVAKPFVENLKVGGAELHNMIRTDISILNLAIKQRMDDHNYRDTHIFAPLETAACILSCACQNLDYRCKEIREITGREMATLRTLRLSELCSLLNGTCVDLYMKHYPKTNIRDDARTELAIRVFLNRIQSPEYLEAALSYIPSASDSQKADVNKVYNDYARYAEGRASRYHAKRNLVKHLAQREASKASKPSFPLPHFEKNPYVQSLILF